MIETARFGALLTEPPCTTFSPAARPMVRSYAQPERFDLSDPKTFTGNLLANRSFVLLRHGRNTDGLAQRSNPDYQRLLGFQLGLLFCEMISRSLFAPHKKEFRFVSYLLDAATPEVNSQEVMSTSELREPGRNHRQYTHGSLQTTLQKALREQSGSNEVTPLMGQRFLDLRALS